MSDRAAVALALAAATGAALARPVPLAVAAVLGAAAVAARRPVVLVVAVFLAASALGERAWDGLRPPFTGPWRGTVTLLSDPQPVPGGLRADARVDGKRVDARWNGRVARTVRHRLAGERLEVGGRLQALSERDRRRLAHRHLSARLTVDRVGAHHGGGWPSGTANALRRILLHGAEPLTQERRDLFAGFVLGDDRGHRVEVTDDFRASGLSHLMVVSGQNVAFVLALMAPALRRMGIKTRFVVGVGVLLMFGVLTRWEPSVLRATAMASLTLLAATLGRPASTLRVLALAVTALVLIDPLLVRSLGFRLSVAACAGIAVLGGRFTSAIPGPRPVATTLGLTLAAQVGVAPVLVPVFGELPVAALPANLLAVPVAGPLMMWGLTAGTVAGLAGGAVSSLLHLPTTVMVAWVAGVARHAAALPLGQLDGRQLSLLAAGAVAVAAGRRFGWRTFSCAATVACLAVFVSPVAAELRPSPVDGRTVATGARLWRAGGGSVVVVEGGRVEAGRLLSGLRRAEVHRVDVLVVNRPGAASARAVTPLLRRIPTGIVLAPPGHHLGRAVVPVAGSEVHTGSLRVKVEAVRPRLQVAVQRR